MTARAAEAPKSVILKTGVESDQSPASRSLSMVILPTFYDGNIVCSRSVARDPHDLIFSKYAHRAALHRHP